MSRGPSAEKASPAQWFDRDVRVGADTVRLLPSIVAERDASRVLLVTGNRSFELSGAAAILEPLQEVTAVQRWTGFSPNPAASEVLGGLREIEEFGPDLIVGIGGGSPMDVAKLLVAFRGLTDQASLDDAIRAGKPTTEETTDLVLIPTTSGSGSEATHFAVVYIGEDKFSVAARSLLPSTVTLDHRLTLSSSPYQRATSGIDALSQAMESLWAVEATDESRVFAREGLQLALEHLHPFVNGGSEGSARGMAMAAHLAGRAIDLTKTTAPHALAYGLTKQHGIPHGHAVALTLGVFLEVHADATREQLQAQVDDDVHARAMATILSELGAKTAREGRAMLASLMTDIGLESDLAKACGKNPVDLNGLASAVNVERLGNNPVVFDHAGLTAVYGASWQDT